LLPMPSLVTERFVAIIPIVLRRRMSRRSRTTVKFVERAETSASAPVWMLSSPTV
jgi:hypothetical protein